MGNYLNPEDVLELYKGETEKPYFVDKTGKNQQKLCTQRVAVW